MVGELPAAEELQSTVPDPARHLCSPSGESGVSSRGLENLVERSRNGASPSVGGLYWIWERHAIVVWNRLIV